MVFILHIAHSGIIQGICLKITTGKGYEEGKEVLVPNKTIKKGLP